MVKPPSIVKFSPKLAVTVAINMVNATTEAAVLVKRPMNKKIPPESSAPFCKKCHKQWHRKMQFISKPFYKKCTFIRMKNDVND